MQLTAKVRLVVTQGQHYILKKTIRRANECCNWLSERAWKTKTFYQFKLHKLAYYDARKKFPDLGSCIIIRCIAKVSQSYAVHRNTRHVFSEMGGIEYDKHLLSWRVDKKTVSIWSLAGRLKLPFMSGKFQDELLRGKIGQPDLLLARGKLYLLAPCHVEEQSADEINGMLGCDLGIVNILSDSDGKIFSGKEIEDIRQKYTHRRRNLQRNGSRSARRKLMKLSGRQARFQKYVNHKISKEVVQKAHDTHRSIALEDLTGIREAKVKHKQRAQHSNWSFFDLRTKIQYKAQRIGIPVILVDPKYTSQQCSSCGNIDRANRKSQSEFECVSCGFVMHADINASRNIRDRALVNAPMVSHSAD